MIKIVLNSRYVLDGLDPSSEFAMTLQEASFKNVTTRDASFSNLVEFAKTAANIRFFGVLDCPNCRENTPYTLYNADVYDDDLLIFSGVFKLMETNHTFKGRVYGSGAGLFDILKGVKITSLDLSSLNHTWTAANVNAKRQATTGVVYPNINYGRWTGTTHAASGVPFTDFYPAVYIDDILKAACAYAGYSYTALGSDFILPFSRQEFKQVASLFGDVESSADESYLLNAGNPNQGIEFDQENNDPLDVFEYSLAQGTYIVANKGVYRISGSIDYVVDALSGTGQIQVYGSTGVVYDFISLSAGDSGTWTFDLEVTNSAVTAFQLYIRLIRVAGDFDIDIIAGSTYVLESGDRQILLGDTIPIADTLPDIDCVELFKYMATRYNALMLSDGKNNTFQFYPFQDIADTLNRVRDWSGKVVNDDDIRMMFHLEDYAQSNYLQYAVQPDADPSRNVAEIGRGVISIADSSLVSVNEMYVAPFCRSAIFEGFSNKGPMLFIPRYSDSTVDYREPDIDPTPRVLRSVIDASLSVTVTGTTAPATQCNPVFVGFDSDVTDYYGAFVTALDKVKVIELDLQLTNTDIGDFDITRPVFLLGSYWFILKVEQFRVGVFAPTKVKLLRLY